jgi:FSR family fosmidomycin resistance protein-like MFS transporter
MPLALGGLIGGTLSDRVGKRLVLVISTGLVGPALWALVASGESSAVLWGPILGIAMGASLPVTLVMAQELIPRGLGLMSGVAMGFTFIAAAIGVSVNGLAADHIGLMNVMMINAVFPLLASGLAIFLPDDRVPLQVSEEAKSA